MYIDAHAHLDKYGEQTEAALSELAECRIFTVAVSMDEASYRRTLELAERSEWILPTFGVHPWNAPQCCPRLDDLDPLLAETPIIGEIGLDFHFVKDEASYPAQRRVFEKFLSAAASQDKIVNLHTKGAEREVLESLKSFGIRRSIVHWYSGPAGLIEPFLEAGAWFTAGVEVLFSERIRKIARRIPLDRLLTETDNPGGFKWLTGRIGMPEVLPQVVEELARLKGVSRASLADSVLKNFIRLGEGDHWVKRLCEAA